MSSPNIPSQLTSCFRAFPDDFELLNLDHLGFFKKGKGISNGDLCEEGIPCITYGQLYTTFKTKIETIHTYTTQSVASQSTPISKNDILIAGSGETSDEIGKASVYRRRNDAVAGGDIIIFTPKTMVDPIYLAHFFDSCIYNLQTRRLGQGHSVVHIYTSHLKDIIVPLPPKDEQRRIANILSTWDRAIELKEDLIGCFQEKYYGMVQRIIQGLLRFQQNYPKWKEVRFGDLLSRVKERVGQRSIPPASIGIKGLRERSEIYNKELSSDYSKNLVFKKNHLCFGIGTNQIVYDALIDEKTYCVSPAYRVFKVSGANPHFIKHYLDVNNKKLSHRYMIKSARQGKNLEFHGLLNERFILPFLEEQNFISSFLHKYSSMIEGHKKELEQLKLQKKGLMQRLLTGKMRV